MEKTLQIFRALADETRLRIVVSLSKKSKTVGQIHKEFVDRKLTISAISHQLKLLYNVGIVKFKKEGRERKYSLSESFCWCILKSSLDHNKGNKHCKACEKIRAEEGK